MEYAYTKKVSHSFKKALERTKEVLATEGFGILSEIDVKETMRKKLEVEYDNYVILGACNPSLAHSALQAEKKIGLFLPCNVIVYEEDGAVSVSAILPTAAMGMVNNDNLQEIATQAETKLKAVVDAL